MFFNPVLKNPGRFRFGVTYFSLKMDVKFSCVFIRYNDTQ